MRERCTPLTLALVDSFGICGARVSIRMTNDTSRTRDQRAQRGMREETHMWRGNGMKNGAIDSGMDSQRESF